MWCTPEDPETAGRVELAGGLELAVVMFLAWDAAGTDWCTGDGRQDVQVMRREGARAAMQASNHSLESFEASLTDRSK